MVAAAASAPMTGASNLRYSSESVHRRIRPAKKVTGYTKFATQYPNCFSSTRVKGSLPIRALDPHKGGGEEEEKKVTGYTKFATQYPNCFSSTRVKGSLPIRALDPHKGGGEEEESSGIANNTSASNSQDDLEYLGKVVVGSIVVAAVTKYGSIVFPEITRPNIIQALIMISTPVIVAILFLIKQSHAEGRS